MANIVDEFEAEQSTDADDVKQKRFERVLDVMQQMQELGHPPKELVGDAVSGLTVFSSVTQCNKTFSSAKKSVEVELIFGAFLTILS